MNFYVLPPCRARSVMGALRGRSQDARITFLIISKSQKTQFKHEIYSERERIALSRRKKATPTSINKPNKQWSTFGWYRRKKLCLSFPCWGVTIKSAVTILTIEGAVRGEISPKTTYNFSHELNNRDSMNLEICMRVVRVLWALSGRSSAGAEERGPIEKPLHRVRERHGAFTQLLTLRSNALTPNAHAE